MRFWVWRRRRWVTKLGMNLFCNLRFWVWRRRWVTRWGMNLFLGVEEEEELGNNVRKSFVL